MKVQFNMRISEQLLARLKCRAESFERTSASLARWILKRYLDGVLVLPATQAEEDERRVRARFTEADMSTAFREGVRVGGAWARSGGSPDYTPEWVEDYVNSFASEED